MVFLPFSPLDLYSGVWVSVLRAYGDRSCVFAVHDVIITLGIFAWCQYEFDLTVLAAVLTVVGYSLNDTIVVFDRVRENACRVRKGDMRESSISP